MDSDYVFLDLVFFFFGVFFFLGLVRFVLVPVLAVLFSSSTIEVYAVQYNLLPHKCGIYCVCKIFFLLVYVAELLTCDAAVTDTLKTPW